MSQQKPTTPLRLRLLAAAGVLVILVLIVGASSKNWTVMRVGLYMLAATVGGVMAYFGYMLFNIGREHARQRKR